MKAMRKIIRGSGFKGVLDYVFDRENGKQPGRLLGGNMSGIDPTTLASEFGVTRKLRYEIKKPVWHNSLRLPAGDHISDDQWVKTGDDYMSRMGFSDAHMRCYVLHDDADGQHIHIVASRIGIDGSLYTGQNENLESTRQVEILEKIHGLTITKGRDLEPDGSVSMPDRSKPKKNETEKSIRTDSAPPRVILQSILDEVMSSPAITVSAFIERLHAASVYVKPSVASTGRLNGFSFSLDAQIWFKGSDLGKQYSVSNLIKNGLNYEQIRDSSAIIAATERASSASSEIRVRDTSSNARDSSSDDSTERRVSSANPVTRAENGNSIHASYVSTEKESHGHEQFDHGDINSDARTEAANKDSIQESHSKIDSHDIHDRLDNWRATADDITSLAAVATPGALESKSLTAAQKAKVDAVTKQLNALDSPLYRLTLISRSDKSKSFNLGKSKNDEEERFFAKKEVISQIPFLSRKNAQNHDIYVTPIDTKNHYIVVDDVRDYMTLLNDGFKPSIIQESSENNCQAIIKIDKAESSKSEQSAANKLVLNLNQKFGDEQFSGVIHPFRLAGFSNKKLNRNNTFTTLILAIDRLCEKSAQMLADIRKSLKNENKYVSEHVEQSETRSFTQYRENHVDSKKVLSATSNNGDLYRRLIKNASNFAEIDMSVIDFRFAKELLKNHSQRDVVNAIIELSPDISSRHANAQAYAQRTVAKAQEALESERRSSMVKSEKMRV